MKALFNLAYVLGYLAEVFMQVADTFEEEVLSK